MALPKSTSSYACSAQRIIIPLKARSVAQGGRVTKWQPDLLHRNQAYAKISFHQYFKLLPTILKK
jgi:hypothetical protein